MRFVGHDSPFQNRNEESHNDNTTDGSNKEACLNINEEQDAKNLLLLTPDDERSDASWKQAHAQKLLEAAIFSHDFAIRRKLYQAALQHESEARELHRKQNGSSPSCSSKSDMVIVVKKPPPSLRRKRRKKKKKKRQSKRKAEHITFVLDITDDETDGVTEMPAIPPAPEREPKSSLPFSSCAPMDMNCNEEETDKVEMIKQDLESITQKSDGRTGTPIPEGLLLNPFNCAHGKEVTQHDFDKDTMPTEPLTTPFMCPMMEVPGVKQEQETRFKAQAKNEEKQAEQEPKSNTTPQLLPPPHVKSAMRSMMDLDISHEVIEEEEEEEEPLLGENIQLEGTVEETTAKFKLESYRRGLQEPKDNTVGVAPKTAPIDDGNDALPTVPTTIVVDLTDKESSDSSQSSSSNAKNALYQLLEDFTLAGECFLGDLLLMDACSEASSSCKDDGSYSCGSWTCGGSYTRCGSYVSNCGSFMSEASRQASVDNPKEPQQQQQPRSKKMVWKPVKDPRTGKTYYYHIVTKETTWTKPELQVIEEGDASSLVDSITEEKKPDKKKNAALKPPKPTWMANKTNGRVYYYNRLTRQTTWTKPPEYDIELANYKSSKQLLRQNPKVELPLIPNKEQGTLLTDKESGPPDDDEEEEDEEELPVRLLVKRGRKIEIIRISTLEPFEVVDDFSLGEDTTVTELEAASRKTKIATKEADLVEPAICSIKDVEEVDEIQDNGQEALLVEKANNMSISEPKKKRRPLGPLFQNILKSKSGSKQSPEKQTVQENTESLGAILLSSNEENGNRAVQETVMDKDEGSMGSKTVSTSSSRSIRTAEGLETVYMKGTEKEPTVVVTKSSVWHRAKKSSLATKQSKKVGR